MTTVLIPMKDWLKPSKDYQLCFIHKSVIKYCKFLDKHVKPKISIIVVFKKG